MIICESIRLVGWLVGQSVSQFVVVVVVGNGKLDCLIYNERAG